jgi:hypothetical protein
LYTTNQTWTWTAFHPHLFSFSHPPFLEIKTKQFLTRAALSLTEFVSFLVKQKKKWCNYKERGFSGWWDDLYTIRKRRYIQGKVDISLLALIQWYVARVLWDQKNKKDNFFWIL